MDITIIISSVLVLTSVIFLLVTLLLVAKSKLLPSGPVSLKINGENEVEVSSGETLLSTLGNNKIFLPSACGGGGTCRVERRTRRIFRRVPAGRRGRGRRLAVVAIPTVPPGVAGGRGGWYRWWSPR